VLQFADSGVAPANGDYLVLRETALGDGGTQTGSADLGWWTSTSGGGSITSETNDLPPGTEGRQAICLTALGSSDWAELAFYLDTCGNGLTFLQLNGRYQLSFKAKGVGGANQLGVNLGRLMSPHSSTYLAQTLTVSNAWNSYSLEFTAAEDGTFVGDVALTFAPSSSAILLDEVSLEQIDTDPSNTTAFRDPVVNALRSLRPGIIRYWAGQLGETLDNLIAAPFARQRSAYTAYPTSPSSATQVQMGLHEFLELCELVGAEPWFVLPITLSPTEMTNLMQYLGGDSATPYGAKRAARGHSAPWTSSFSGIHLEFGNEAWNGTFKGGDMENPVAYGNRGNELFGAAKACLEYVPAQFDFVLGGQEVYVARNIEIANASTNHDSFALAPYIGGTVNSYRNNEELFGPLFAEPQMTDGGGYMGQNLAAIQNSAWPVPLAVYEVNLSTTAGDISQAALNSFAPSVGAGLATANHMLLMLRDLGIRVQNLFCLSQYAYGLSDGEQVRLWGVVLDMGVTDRRRPQFLAEELANEAIGGDLLQTSLSGENPTWNQPLMNGVQLDKAHYLQSYAFSDGNRTSLVLFNLSRSAALSVNFSGPNTPGGAVLCKRLTSGAITNGNEEAELVRTTSQTLAGFDSSQPFSLPPYSMTVLRWPAVLATANLVGPTNGAAFQAPALVLLTATANDPDGNLQKVEFFEGATKIGEAAAAPFTCAWTNVAPGDYALSARAVGLAGVSTNSPPAWITVNPGPPGPTIISQVESTNVTAGASVTLAIAATGATPLTYQWQFNGTNLGGVSTNSSLTLSSAQPGNSGSYDVVVSNAAAAATSACFTLDVLPGYSIGLKFGADQCNSSLAPTAVAGAPGVAQANWNNLMGANGTKTNLVADATGIAEATDVSVQWAGPSYTWCSVWSGDETNGAGFMIGTPDHYLMGGCILGGDYNPTQVAISGLPAQLTSAGYDIYLYALSSDALSGGGYRVLDASDGNVIYDYVLAQSPVNPTNYIQVPANLGPGQLGIGDYIVFSDLTAGNIVIEVWANENVGIGIGNLLAPVNAIQLVTRPTVNLSVIAPSVIVPPQSQVAAAGSSPTFQVSAAGSTPLAYQWQFNSVDLDGATNASLTLNNARIADDGSYTVIVSNPAGSVTSSSATLAVSDELGSPIITAQPQALTVGVGQTATFNVTAARTALSSYQWQLNGANIPGATNSSLTLTDVQFSDAGDYSVVVANAVGSAASASALLTVINLPPVIRTQPQSQTVNQGSDVLFSVTAGGSGPLSCQWLFNGSPLTDNGRITGSQSNFLAIANVSPGDAGNYVVVVGSAYGSVTSSVANLLVVPWEPSYAKVEWWYNSNPAEVNNLAALEGGGLGPARVVVAAPQVGARENDVGPAWDNGRITCWFVPPASGPYSFYVNSDDGADLFLSTDSSPEDKRMIAQETGYSSPLQWLGVGWGSTVAQKCSDGFVPPGAPAGTAPPYANGIYLAGGQRYYLELDHYNGTGGENCEATATPTGSPPANGAATALTGGCIGCYVPQCAYVAFTNQPASVTNATPFTPVTFTAGGVTDSQIGIMGQNDPAAGTNNFMLFQWTTNGTAVPGANTSSFTITAEPSLNNAQIACQMRALGYVDAAGAPLWSNSTVAVLTVATNIALPRFVDVDLGRPGTAGSVVTNADGSLTITGGGADIWGSADQCNYFYTTLAESQWSLQFKIDADIAGGDPTWAKCEVMCRKSNPTAGPAAGDAFIAMMYTKPGGADWLADQFRTVAGGPADWINPTQPAYKPPTWLKLARNGSVFSCEYSLDGSTWTDYIDLDTSKTTPVGSGGTKFGTPWPDTVTAGIAVTAHNNAESASVNLSGLWVSTVVTWANPAPIVYGAALGAGQLNAAASLPGSFAYTPANGTVLKAGRNTLSVIFTPTDTVHYSSVTDSVSLVVSPAPLTVTANNQTKTYGQTVTFTGTEFATGGLVNGDTVTSVTLASPGAAAAATVAGSPYNIVPSAAQGTGLANYTITYANGTLTVNPAALTITANNRTKTYGQTVTFAGTEFTTAGLVNANTVTSVTLTSPGAAATATVAGSPYAIVPSAPVGAGLANYTVSLVNGTLTVGQATPTMTWTNPAAIIYGTALSSNQLDATANVPGSFAYTPTNGTVINAGTNRLSVVFTPADPVDYSSATDSVSLLVSPAPLTVTAANASRAYGQANPVFTGAITGVTNGDNITASYSCSATSTSPAGTYPIVPSLVDPSNRQTNYTVSLVNGILTVGQVTGVITWTNPAPIMYGTALGSNQLNAAANVPGSFAYTPTNGTVLDTGTSTLSVVFTPADPVDYSSLTDSVSLVVSPASLTVTAANASRVYGQTNPVFTGTIAGVTNGDNITATYSCSATASSPAGTYPIVPSLVDPNDRRTNYTVSLVNGTLTVGQAAPQISLQPTNQSVVLGGGASFSVSATGTAPLAYQWQFDGANLTAATNATLVLSPVAAANAGSYDVVITNAYGSVTSAAPTLSVLGVPVSFVTSSGGIRYSNGQFHLTLSGLTGQGSVLIEASTNLTQWTAIFTNPPGFGSIQFVDPATANFRHRYYRATTPGP